VAMFSRCSKQHVSFRHRFCRNKSYKSASWRSMKYFGARFASGEQQCGEFIRLRSPARAVNRSLRSSI
jgi:hypothetical protein